MNSREMTLQLRLSHWAEILKARSQSGLSIKAFCEANDIRPDRFFYWQRKLRGVAAEQLISRSENQSQAMIPQGWAVCKDEKSTQAEPSVNSLSIEIGKCRVTVGADANPEQLAKVCRVLMSLC